MRHLLGLAAGLVILWLLLSGHYAPLTLALGAASCVFTVALCRRLRLIDAESVPLELLPRLPGYAAWLGLQILRSNLDVAGRLLIGHRAISPRTVVINTRPLAPLGQAILANSITLTPGTVTVGLENGEAIVHTLTREGAADIEAGTMAGRVARLEGGPD
ncbi:Na+/H+ antiporter subunit E [Salinisphaera sp. LB1]|uniref:Na+/H+ antiporter subunit E n=1 Tax=Salinisphaera sp. LB1 TaxID=2183911 RepID=UPI000D7E9C4B|nr:Na+/H+ antiporter subunit E [Salinisphaera sp. LB1]AWN16646.1 Cation antiporter precursor [Salinisphaera sp. LB1]